MPETTQTTPDWRDPLEAPAPGEYLVEGSADGEGVCRRCGALVRDTRQHLRFHHALNRLAQKAGVR